MRSGEQERIDFILQFSSMEESQHALIERQVEKFSHLGMVELVKYWQDRLGLGLFRDDHLSASVTEIVELKNIMVHNHGLVSSLFKRRVPDFDGEVGERVDFSLDVARLAATLLAESVEDIDRTSTPVRRTSSGS